MGFFKEMYYYTKLDKTKIDSNSNKKPYSLCDFKFIHSCIYLFENIHLVPTLI